MSCAATTEVLVIGYGNLLRGDDGAGQIVAQELARRGAAALFVHQLTPELAFDVAEAARVIFVDAQAGLPPGEVSEEAVEPYPHPAALGHFASPAGLLQLALEVYGRCPPASLVGIGGADFDLGSRLSPACRRGVDEAVRRISVRAAAAV